MTDKQPDALRQAAWLKKEGASCQRHYDLGVLIERQHAELETLRAGYAAARLEIESLRGRGVEPAGEYPALPGRTIDELTESQRESAIAAYRAAHEQDPDFGFAPDRAWVEGAAYVDALAAGQATAAPQPGAAYAALPESLMLAVDRWFADNTGLGGCSGKDVRELAELFYDVTHEGGRESVDDALAIVESFGPGISGLNDTYARQILLAEEVKRLRASHGQAPAGEESKPHGWLYDWTHSSATGKPDTTYTGFTKDEAHARKHDNCTAVFTKPQPSPAAQGDALDTTRLDWLDADASKCVFHLGKSWYTRPSYGLPYRKRASLREAIDSARAAQEDKKP